MKTLSMNYATELGVVVVGDFVGAKLDCILTLKSVLGVMPHVENH